MATFSDIPENSVSYAAECVADFQEVCLNSGARPKAEYVKYKHGKPPKRFFWVGMKLDCGRFAALYKEDQEAHFRVYLQGKSHGFYLADLEEVRRSIGVSKFEIFRLDNGLKWAQPENAELIDLPIKKPTTGMPDGLTALKTLWANTGIDINRLEAEIRAEHSKSGNGSSGAT